ncbi:phosphotransferase [Nocardia sp. NPDC005366]|uniref:phosphotransferase n=1 Tax=Nocardia sp. NPDC005366 TaxID=3156878 RepID=UPI0033AE59D6
MARDLTRTGNHWPTSSADITPEWLSWALSERHPGTIVTDVSVPDIVYRSAVKAHLAITYEAGASNGLPESMYLKGGLGGEMAAISGPAYINEVRFFSEFADRIPVDKPRHFYAGIGSNGDGLLLMEDLSERASFGRAASGESFTVEMVAQILEQQATLHALFWESPELEERDWLNPAVDDLRGLIINFILSKDNWDKQVGARSEVVPESVRDRDAVIEALRRMWAFNDTLPRTLLHGDPHQDNCFITRDGVPALLDWQTAQAGVWAHDVTYTIIGCLSIEDRRASLTGLLDGYLNALAGKGVTSAPGREEALLAVRRNVWHSFLWWLTPVEMQPDATSRIVGERFAVAALDLESFAAVGMER